MTAPQPPPEAIRLALRIAQAQGKSYYPHKPHGKQQKFLDLDCLEGLYGGQAGSGKSDALLGAALKYFHVPGYAAILFRRTYTDLALPGAIMDRSHDWLAGKAEWNDRDKTWASKEGATLTFGYLDGPRDHYRYQSAEFQFIGLDELTQFLEKQYRYMFSRLRRLKDAEVPIRMRGATNPGGIGHDWVQKRFGIPDEVRVDQIYEHQGRVFVPAGLKDNPSIDAEEYRRALAELDAVTRDQLEHGKWIRDSSGLVYKADRRQNVVDKLPQLPAGEVWSYVLGLDFGYVDETAFAVLAFTEHHPTVYVVAAGAWAGLTPSAAGKEIQKLEADYSFDRIVGDIGGLGKGYAEEAKQRFGLPVEAAEKANKLGYIKLLNGDLQTGKLMFLAGTAEETLTEMERLAWSDEKQNKEHPSLPNHRCDALLYGWREAKHWAWEPRKESNEDTLRKRAKAAFAPGEEHEVEQWEKEQRTTRRVAGLLRL